MDWIDISLPLKSGMARWPGDPPVLIERISDLAQGDEATVSAISMGCHTGTHMDAPLHYLPQGAGLDSMPLAAVMGPARVLEIRDPRQVTPAELRPHRIRCGERILLKTGNSALRRHRDSFSEDFVSLSPEAAAFLAARGIRSLGIDALSVGGMGAAGDEVHRLLLAGGVWIMEGLDLSGVEPGRYRLVCLPLKIPGSDGAPARAVLGRRSAASRHGAHAHLRALKAIGDTAANLREAIAGETHEFKSMYPAMIAKAKEEGHKAAERTFTYANEVEKIHADLYRKALDNLANMRETEYHVCSVCGYTCEDTAPEKCPVCGANHRAFAKTE